MIELEIQVCQAVEMMLVRQVKGRVLNFSEKTYTRGGIPMHIEYVHEKVDLNPILIHKVRKGGESSVDPNANF